MNIFKQALINPETALIDPKSYALTPVVTNTQSFYEEFMGRITQIVSSTPGWGGWNLQGVFDQSQFTLSGMCPHQQTVYVALSTYMMMSAPVYGGGIAMADDAFTRLVNTCKTMHANIPPPGQFVYALGQNEPIGFSSPYVPGGMLKMDDFKQLCAEEYAKQIEYLTQYAYSSASVSVGNFISGSDAYGYGTPSILSTILKLCPGLATVQRPCPDKCPEYGNTKLPLSNMIQHINDMHQWSREKIAEWLDIIAIDDPSVDLTIKPIKKEQRNDQPSIGAGEEFAIKNYGGISFNSDNYPF